MARIKCLKCVGFAKCEHKEIGLNHYRFVLRCNECSSVDERIKEVHKSNGCRCPFCGEKIEKPNETKKNETKK